VRTVFKDASSIESVVWDMKLADLPRSSNRARINELFNGNPPYSDEEQIENNITTNVNWLDGTKIAHDARQQFSQAFLKPGNFFTVKLDSGPIHKRQEWSDVITTAINKRLKKSLRYRETLRNVFAQVVLHGVGPVAWENRQKWCPTMFSMADVLLPSQTLLTMENVQHFALFRRYTPSQLWRMTHGPRVDKGWQMSTVDACIEWAYKQRGKTQSSNAQVYSPEKIAEDIKSDLGLYQSDAVPTIDCWDFYYLDDSKKNYGWKRRIVLDTPSLSDASKSSGAKTNIIGGKNQFLFDPGNRNYAGDLDEIIHFQFADGSVVAPFRYHSVRSVGFLLYAVCHIQNRLRCKLNDAAFEDLMQYFRVANPTDVERLKKVDLVNYGIIPEGLNFVSKSERWDVNHQLSQVVMNFNRQQMAENATGYNQDFGHDPSRGEKEKTATQVAAEVNKSTAMVGAILQDAYGYQEFQYVEICRRMCLKNSSDIDASKFRKECLKAGVPEEYLDSDRWNVNAERVIGNGNKQVELAQNNMLMQNIDRFDPDAQRLILRQFTFAATDDPALTLQLVPQEKTLVTHSVHDAELSASTLLSGLPMGLKQGVNHGEYAATLIGMMKAKVEEIMASGGVAPAPVLAGLENIAGMTVEGEPIEGNGAANHIAIMENVESNAQLVKQLNDSLTQMLNEVKGMAQRLAEQQQAEQQQGGGMDPADAVKLKSQMILAEAKAEDIRKKGELKLKQKQEEHELKMANTIRETQVDEAATDLLTQGQIRRQAKENMEEPALST
jgi:hypothetical protein